MSAQKRQQHAFICLSMALSWSVCTELCAREPDSELQKAAIKVDEASPELIAANKFVAEQLGIIRRDSKAPRSFLTNSGSMVFVGDLFRADTVSAVFEVPSKSDNEPHYNDGLFGFAELVGPSWRLRGLWNIPPVWRPATWKQPDDDPLPIKPASTPFELRDFDGDRIPELVVAGEADRYYQEYYLLRFNQATHGLDLVATAMGRPEIAGQYTRLYVNSGRRAIFEEWEYLFWLGGSLRSIATWHEESPYNNEDPDFIRVTVAEVDGHDHQFLVTRAETESAKDSAFEMKRDGAPYAHITIAWNESGDASGVPDSDTLERAWLFEKTTGIERRYFPKFEGAGKVPNLERFATIHVDGEPKAVKRFTHR